MSRCRRSRTTSGSAPPGLAWVVNAYLITFGGLLLLAGRIGDLYGRRRVFLAGLALFTAASVLCGAAQNPGLLVAARFLQGAGGALTSAVILGMIVTMFPEPRLQARAIGVYAFVASAGGAVGLLAGGVLTQWVSWHWIFFVNLPIGIAGAFFAARLLPHDAGAPPGHASADVLGAVLITAALMLGVYTIVVPAADDGWASAATVSCGAGAVALLVAFLVRESTASKPLMPLRILRSRNVAGANLMQVVGAGGMFGSFFLGALYLQHVLHYSPLEIGFAFLPVSVLMGGLSVRYTERLVSRFGVRPVMMPGLVLITAGLALFASCAGRRQLRGPRASRDGVARHRCGAVLPADDGSSHERSRPRRRGARLGPGEHDRSGRCGDRSRCAGHSVDRTGGDPARRWCCPARRADRRLPPGALGGGRDDGRGPDRRAHRRPSRRRHRVSGRDVT